MIPYTFMINVTDDDKPVTGTPKSDTLHGTAGDDVIQGLGGNGSDTASYARSTNGGVIISLQNPNTNTGDVRGDSYMASRN